MHTFNTNMCTRLVCIFVIAVVKTQLDKAAAGCFDASVSDICNNTLPEIPDISSRDPTTMITNETSHWKYCDLYAIRTQTWYSSENNMTSSCPSMYMCGAKLPIWMTEANPEPQEGIVNRTACLKDFEDCCLIRYRLATVNCGDSMAYCLIDAPSGCHQRYCFDVKESGVTYSSPEASTKTLPFPESTTTMHLHSSSPVTTIETDEHDVDGDDELIIILMACMGLMAATILGLMVVIVRNRRSRKVDDETAKSAATVTTTKLEQLSIPGLKRITLDKSGCPVDDIYRILNYESLKGQHGVVDGLGKTGYDTLDQHIYQTAYVPGEQNAEQNTLGSLYDDEDRY